MAELLIRIVDKVNPDSPALDAGCTKRGMVIAVCSDGWAWGSEELTNPEWRIVQVTNLTVDECNALLARDGLPIVKNGPPPQFHYPRRNRKLNLDDATIPQAIRDHFTNSTTRTIIKIAVSRAIVNAVMVTVAPIPI